MELSSSIQIISVAVFLSAVLAQLDDNELIGNPQIHCNAETIDMQFKTKKQFTGKVYVKGNFIRPECRVDYSKKTADGLPVGGIRLNHGACNMDRQRMLFVTKMDKAYNIKCMYREAIKTVTAHLDVSMLPTESVSFDLPMPSCSYTIRKDSLDGDILQYARVGDQVVHRWQCDSEEYGVLVHNCYVEDGQGEKQLIVDSNGCHTDHLLLGDPTYVEALNLAYRESYVFKFADRVAVRFQCEIRLCFKEDGGCDGITPPLCFDANHVHSSEKIQNKIANNTISQRSRRSTATKDADLFSQTVYVFDKDSDAGKIDAGLILEELSSQRVCLGPHGIAWAASIMALVFIALSTAILFLLYQRFNRFTEVFEGQKVQFF